MARAAELGLAVALDIAFQVAPDHPYVREHESWFRKRPDGTIQYAENPPKKYQDIFPLDFESEDWASLWEELKSVFLYWLQQGVTIFRVDNPHTKAFAFWEWVIGEIKRDHPEALFLSEAFTRPKVMYRLAKIGFSQSYTYFPMAQREAGDRRLHNGTDPDSGARVLQAEPMDEHARIFLPSFCRSAAGRRLRFGCCWPLRWGPATAVYGPAFELLENRPIRPRKRRVSRLGEVRDPPLGSAAAGQPAPPDDAGERNTQQQPGA